MAGARDADVALGLTVKLAASAAGSGGGARAPYAQTTRAVEYAFDITSFSRSPSFRVGRRIDKTGAKPGKQGHGGGRPARVARSCQCG